MGKTIQVFGFPYLLSAEVVKSFLEKYTGYGTVCALEVKQSKGGSRAFAKVQFADNISADKIITLANNRLYFGSSYLKAWEMKADIVQLRAYVDQMDGITLNFGCQISDDKFAVLGSTEVSIQFGIGLKKFFFFLSSGSADYKLQLSYENIWQVVLHRPYGQNAQFLLIQDFLMANFEDNVMIALYWGGEIITEINGFRYNECARMIVSMSISTNYVELIKLLHEKMGTDGENIQLDISGKYPCSFQGNVIRFIEFKIENDQSLVQFFAIPQKFLNKIDINLLEMYIKIRPINQDNLFRMNDQHGYHMNLLAQNYGFATFSQPHFTYTATHGIHQSFDEGSGSQRHIESIHNQYEIREDEATFDLCNDAHAQRSDENSEEDEPSEDDGESKVIESESDEDIGDLPQNESAVNFQNQFDEMQNNDIPYFTTLETEEDIFISTRESEMKCCSVWVEDAKKDLEKNMYFSSKTKLKRAVTIWSLRKNKEFKIVISTKSVWTVRCRFYDSLGCPWFLRGRKVGGSLWKIGKYFNNHRCETEGLTTGHTNLDTNLIASLFLNQISKNPKLLVVDVMSKVHEKFGHQVTYRKAWLGRQRAFTLVYGDFQKSFSELPKFFAAFQYFNPGTVVEWKHEESMSSPELFGAPRIYKRLQNSCYSFFKETPDDQWVRTTDFPPSWIGLSSSLCLQFRRGVRLPNFEESFFHYAERENNITLQTGFTFFISQKSALVPNVQPPEGISIPYKILFKISSLVQHGCIPGPALNVYFFRLVDPRRRNVACIEHALEKLYYIKECCYDPVRWLTEQYDGYLKGRQPPKSPSITLDDGLVYVRRVLVTPCKVYFCGPEVNVSNRVLRNYSEDIDNFLRVSFVDEEWEKLYSTDLLPKASTGSGVRTNIYERILSTLRKGFVIGDKKFEFLAFSSSQLRDNSVWMFASRPGLTANDIRAWMGDFSQIKNVAKYAARLGQSFGSSRETLSVLRHEIEVIPDVKVHGTSYVFSDGIGKISGDFAHRVASKCGLQYTPSAFQIRYGGYKGVVGVDPDSSMKLSLRKSMSKYKSDNIKLDVLGWSKYQPCYLNRQLITLLSTLGVKDEVLEQKQKEAVDQLDAILHDSLKAQEALELMSPGENTNILKAMLNCGYKPDAEPFLSMMLQTFRASKLLDLRTKSRIFIPNGRTMMGCLDESRTLEYGQVFVQFTGAGHREFSDDLHPFNNRRSTNSNFILKGNVVVAKNPCLHPGDIRVLRAVNVRALHHMVDCVVFPQKGKRPHPNECSGSDLDGDIYFVCWDQDMIPPRQVQPMEYPPAPSIQLDHDVTIEEVEEYFTNYIVNDSLGIIANAHVVFADREPDMAMSDPCKKLAELFSIAVDFPKTGVPAEIPSQLRPKEYPDFMDKPDKTSYISERVIGKLFRKVKDKAPQASSIATFTREVARRSYDADMEVDGFEDYIDEAFDYKTEYDNKLGNLMDYYGIKTEAEILSGGIMKTSKTFDRRKDADAISVAVRALRKEARAWFKRRNDIDDMLPKASAWYHVTYHPTYWGCYNQGLKRAHFISFPWCVYDQLIQIKKDKARNRPVLSLTSLRAQLSHRLVLK